MKRFYFIIAFSFLLIVSVNVMFYRSFYNLQINQYKNFLLRQSEVCVNEVERTLLKFESDLNYILFSDDIAKLFTDVNSDAQRKLQLFYSTYNGLIKNIDIYDNQKNVLNLFRDKKQNFIIDQYVGQRQRMLAPKEEVTHNGHEYQYVLPVFKDNVLYANIIVTININNYILSELKKFHLDEISWQFVIDTETETVATADVQQYNWNGRLEEVVTNLNHDLEGLMVHTISTDSLNHKILTVYTPVNLLDRNFGIAMSIDHNTFLLKVFSQLAIISIASLLIFLLVSIYLLIQIKNLKKKIEA